MSDDKKKTARELILQAADAAGPVALTTGKEKLEWCIDRLMEEVDERVAPKSKKLEKATDALIQGMRIAFRFVIQQKFNQLREQGLV